MIPYGRESCVQRNWQSGRLWSLLDMLKLNAAEFYHAALVMEHIHAVARTLEMKPGHDPKSLIPVNTQASMAAWVRTLLTHLEVLEAKVTAFAAEEFAEKLKKKKATHQDVKDQAKDISRRLEHELSLRTLLVIKTERIRFFEPSEPPFGQEVADKLPLAIPDIEDAGRCLAFMQGTAAVFHLMRVMEAGLKSLGSLLGIPYAPSWESYITQIDAKIAAKHKTKSVKWKADEPFYRDILGDLQSIKIAWRNPTMHIVRRYSPDEAEDIFRAVCKKRLAPRLPEPKI
jgi:hypothetical protein